MTAEQEWARPPATVFLPTTGELVDDAHQVVAREVASGDLVITAYSDVDELRRCCGTGQPWVEFAWDSVEDLRQQLDALVVLDLPAYDTLDDLARAVTQHRDDEPDPSPRPR